MKKRLFISVVVVMALMLSLSVNAFADFSPLANPNITSKTGSIEKTGNGNINIAFNVTANSTMVTLGASSITLYKSNGEYVATLSSDDYNNMLASNTFSYGSKVPYKGVSGQSYYATITFYAENDSGSSTSTYTTTSVTA